MTESPDFSALIGSRICHDLVNPIGAIGNGVELMMMDGTAKGPELALIAESVASATARIRFFRIAFGASGDQRIARSDVLSILSVVSQGGRLFVRGQHHSRRLRLQAFPLAQGARQEAGSAHGEASGDAARRDEDRDGVHGACDCDAREAGQS